MVPKDAKVKPHTARRQKGTMVPSDTLLIRLELLENQVIPIGRFTKLGVEVCVIAFFATLHWGLKWLLVETQSDLTWWVPLSIRYTELLFVVGTFVIGFAEVLTVIADQSGVIQLQIKRIRDGK